MQISCFDTNYRYNDEDEPSQFEDELALLDEIEMEMQDNFDDNDMPAGIISISNNLTLLHHSWKRRAGIIY